MRTFDSGLTDYLTHVLQGQWISHGNGWNFSAYPICQNTEPGYNTSVSQFDQVLEIGQQRQSDRPISFFHSSEFSVRAAECFTDKRIPRPNIHAVESGYIVVHENSNALALGSLAPSGRSTITKGGLKQILGPPHISLVSALPIGIDPSLQSDPFLAPYKYFVDRPFFGIRKGRAGPGFHPLDVHALLNHESKRSQPTQTLEFISRGEQYSPVDTAHHDRPLVTPTTVTAWLSEYESQSGKTRYVLRYSKVSLVEFLQPNSYPYPGMLRFPQITINTLEKV